MDIRFPPVDEHFIKTKIEDGFYSDATDLVRDAVRRLREFEDSKYDRLMAALDAGEQAIKDGRVTPYTPALLAQIEEEALAHAAAGRKPDPDVCG